MRRRNRYGRRRYNRRNLRNSDPVYRGRNRYVPRKKLFPTVLLTNPNSVKNNLPMPSVYRTVLTCTGYGQIPQSTADNMVYEVKGNCAFHPFDPTAGSTPNINLPLSIGGTAGATLIFPAGYQQFMGTVSSTSPSFYNRCRVLASMIKVEWYPNNGNDEGLLVVAPVVGDTNYDTAQEAASAPFAKSRFVTVNGVASPVKIISYLSTAKATGRLSTTVRDDISFAHAAFADPGVYWNWQIIYSKANPEPTDGIIPFRVTVQYYVQLENTSFTRLNDA